MTARIILTILRYPAGAEVGFAGEFSTEYRRVEGYHYAGGAFYVVFSEGSMVHMDRLDKLVVSVNSKRRIQDAGKQKNNKKRRHYYSQRYPAGDRDTARGAG